MSMHRITVHGLGRSARSAVAAVIFTASAWGQPVLTTAPNQLSDQERSEGFAVLFDGVSLSGWTTSGNPEAWRVEHGQITTNPDAPGGGWWLRTTRQYRDFDLRLDFKIPENGNSGIGLRSSSTTDPAFSGMEVQIYDNFGHEASINGCGAVYNAIVPAMQAVHPAGQWNSYRILLVGDTLNVWLNDQQIHDDQKLDDRGYYRAPDQPMPLRDRLTTGYIALQEHGNPVYFRNIRIKDLSPDPDPGDFVPVFNSTDLAGWTARGAAAWTVEDGVLVGRDGPGHLFTDASFSDLEMRAQVKINSNGNSGFYFRTVPAADNPDSWPTGYEAQIDQHDPKNFTGCIYNKAWPAGTPGPITRDNAWFDYRVRAVGGHIQTWINGRPMVDASLTEFDRGQIVLQSHHQGNEVQWRDIQVRDLSAAGSTPPAGAARPVRLFYCTHSAGFRHDVLPETRQIMRDLGERLDWLEVHATDDISELTPDRLRDTDAVMLFTTGMLPMGQMREAVMQWVLDGGALIGVHSATDTFAEYEPYVRAIGGTFDGHPWNEEVTIAINDPAHPAMRAFLALSTATNAAGQASFTIADEIYQFRSLNMDMHVLMSLDRANPNTEPQRPYPLAWTREHGKGRVFYTALGHRPEVWQNPAFVDHLTAGIWWSADLPGAMRADALKDRANPRPGAQEAAE